MALRCFIAIEIPGQVKELLAETQDGLKKTRADVRWVPLENVHITLKFLGSTEEAFISDISGELARRVATCRPFYIKITGVGCFPDLRRPRVIWVGIGESQELTELARDVELGMVEIGCQAEERKFSPHLTIGRVRSPRGIPDIMRAVEKLGGASFGSMEVSKISLMKSELRPAGAIYSSLAEIPFGGEKI